MGGTVATYAVVFEGCAADGEALLRVKARLAATFKMSPEQVERLCRSRNVVVRRGLSRDQAVKFQQAFLCAGAACRIEPQAGAPASARKPVTLSAQTLDHFFRGPLPKVTVPWSYRAGLFLVASLMLLLPVLYVSILAGVAVAGLWYAMHAPGLLAGQVRGWVWLVAYIAPLAAAIGVCLALLKPLLARDPQRREPLLLMRSEEPLLFAFVERICDLVGAPRPARIQVNCAVNASAGLQPGLRGLVGGGLVLTIGMPLFAGLDTRQLAGVLAHEFGHFAQRAGMRAGYLVTHINGWLYRAVYLPDSWDAWLVRVNERLDHALAIPLWIARAASWGVRRLLWGLMWTGTLASRYLSRQMEFDADRYEARLAGSATFRQTAFHLRLLSHAFDDVYRSLGRSWADRKLVDNLPQLTGRRARELEPQRRHAIDAEMGEAQTRYFDTHPADNERVDNAERLNAPGVFSHRAPANVLLRQYEQLAQRTTWFFYRYELGLNIKPDQLISIGDHQATVTAVRQDNAALLKYFHGFYEPYHFLPALDVGAARALAASARQARLAELLAQVRASGPAIQRVVPAFAAAKRAAIQAYGESALPGAPATYNLAAAALAEAEAEFRKLEPVFCERLALGLAEALTPNDAPAKPEALTRLLDVQAALARVLPACQSAYCEGMAVHQLAWHLNDDNERTLALPLAAVLRKLRSDIATIEAALQATPYPFARGRGDTDILSHLLEELPRQARESDSADYLEYAQALQEALAALNARTLGRLASLAAAAEEQLGLRIKLI